MIPSPPRIPSRVPEQGENKVVYFPSCVTRVMGSSAGKKDLLQSFISVAGKAGFSVIIPHNIHSTCCSQIFSSKGLHDAFRYKANEIVERLWDASQQGNVPVVTDVSSCAYTLKTMRSVLTSDNKPRYDKLIIQDSIEFIHDHVLPVTRGVQKKGSIVLHPVCSLEKMRTYPKFIAVARFFADSVTVPEHAGCCGMAGDRGFMFPELTSSATRGEADEVRKGTFDGYYSSTKTCEMALSAAVKSEYESLIYLADECMA